VVSGEGEADRQTETDRQCYRNTHSEQLGCCATHLQRRLAGRAFYYHYYYNYYY